MSRSSTAPHRHVLLAVLTMAVLAPMDRSAAQQPAAPIDQILRAAVERGDVPGVVAMAATSDRIIYQGAFGSRHAATGEPMAVDSMFVIASMTKAITSVAAMQLVETGELSLDGLVSEHIPGFADLQVLEGFDAAGVPRLRPPAGPVTLRHLLTHTSGFGYEIWDPLLREAAGSLMPRLFEGGAGYLQAPLVFDPGSRWQYGISTDWLGRLVEAVRGTSLDQVFETEIFGPLRMTESFFNPPAEASARLATVHLRQPDGNLVERTPTDLVPRTPSGGGGLYSTAPDYMRFLRALLRGGELEGRTILQAGTVSRMGQDMIAPLEMGFLRTEMPALSNDFELFPGSTSGFGLGFAINHEPIEGGRAVGSLAWAGLYNTYFWVDPTTDVCGVLMTQILPFYDANVVSLLSEFESAVYGSLDENGSG